MIVPDLPRQATFITIGATGNGKTSFINRVTGSRLDARSGEHSTAEDIVVGEGNPYGRKIYGIDTRGFNDPDQKRHSDQTIRFNIATFLKQWENGVNGIMIVINGTKARYTPDIRKQLAFVYRLFGRRDAVHHVGIVVTRCTPNSLDGWGAKELDNLRTMVYEDLVGFQREEWAGGGDPVEVHEPPIFYVDSADMRSEEEVRHFYDWLFEIGPLNTDSITAVHADFHEVREVRREYRVLNYCSEENQQLLGELWEEVRDRHENWNGDVSFMDRTSSRIGAPFLVATRKREVRSEGLKSEADGVTRWENSRRWKTTVVPEQMELFTKWVNEELVEGDEWEVVSRWQQRLLYEEVEAGSVRKRCVRDQLQELDREGRPIGDWTDVGLARPIDLLAQTEQRSESQSTGLQSKIEGLESEVDCLKHQIASGDGAKPPFHRVWGPVYEFRGNQVRSVGAGVQPETAIVNFRFEICFADSDDWESLGPTAPGSYEYVNIPKRYWREECGKMVRARVSINKGEWIVGEPFSAYPPPPSSFSGAVS